MSKRKAVLSHVPQESILAPILFHIFISDTGSGIECTLSKLAGDPKLSGVVDSLEGKDAIQRDLGMSKQSHLDYCIQPQGLQYKEDMDLLERVQRHYVKNKVSETNEELRKKGKNGVLWKPTHDQSSLAKVLESSVAEKALGVLVDTKSTRRQQAGHCPEPHQRVPGETSPGLGGMGQVNCCRGPRDDPDPVQQCTPVPASPQPLLRQRVRLSQGRATRKRDLLLFGDALVIAKPKRGSAPRPQLCLALGQLQVLSSRKGAAGDAAQEEEEGRHTNSLVLVWPCGFCTVTFPSRALKELWLSALLGPPEGVEGARLTQLPSIKLLLQELSGRNAATTLHASSLQRLVQGQAQRRGDSAQRPRERSPGASPPPRLFALLSLAAGGTRRRRRGLPWPFARRRGSSAAAEAAGQSGSGGRGALFGQPLAALCSQDGTLPQPIQDLLALLAEHGPSTEGIFRLAVKEHVSRELREALDSGAEVHLESQPVHVLAVLLKDFLRKIPSKLLGAELYEEWMSALQKTSRQEKLAALREVAGKLPQANLLLLKSLLSLLQRISRNAASSRMTAGNLAICVGPNLLSPPEEQTLPLDALVQVTGQVPPVAAESQHLKSSSGERR
ncbi:uncharacterized protein LOC129205280 [Grus americana]|uniref:uncharacterized protein LOC129205280 n=2 Tax=Grus americana TaxID=9117 RepID=UPI002407A08B|nr:uncharacterized protein LOC129205280 [Grus americana]